MSNTLKPTPYKAIHLEEARAAQIMFNVTPIGKVAHMDKAAVNQLVQWLNDAYCEGVNSCFKHQMPFQNEANQERLSEVGK